MDRLSVIERYCNFMKKKTMTSLILIFVISSVILSGCNKTPDKLSWEEEMPWMKTDIVADISSSSKKNIDNINEKISEMTTPNISFDIDNIESVEDIKEENIRPSEKQYTVDEVKEMIKDTVHHSLLLETVYSITNKEEKKLYTIKCQGIFPEKEINDIKDVKFYISHDYGKSHLEVLKSLEDYYLYGECDIDYLTTREKEKDKLLKDSGYGVLAEIDATTVSELKNEPYSNFLLKSDKEYGMGAKIMYSNIPERYPEELSITNSISYMIMDNNFVEDSVKTEICDIDNEEYEVVTMTPVGDINKDCSFKCYIKDNSVKYIISYDINPNISSFALKTIFKFVPEVIDFENEETYPDIFKSLPECNNHIEDIISETVFLGLYGEHIIEKENYEFD